MLYSIVINSAPHSLHGGTSYNALQFARALLRNNHRIHRLFFYGEGVYNLNAQAITPQGEFDLAAAWQHFIDDNSIDGVVCIAAAARRGILDDGEAKRHGKAAATLLGASELSGLGQLIEATAVSDRVITFG
ncbi:MAG TPA: sulfurtransferase complex subunit TusD [Marinagarivorans sp.]